MNNTCIRKKKKPNHLHVHIHVLKKLYQDINSFLYLAIPKLKIDLNHLVNGMLTER